MIQPNTAPVERGGEQDDSEMEMIIDKASMVHIISIIRAQLYSDKIGSPIREYASNAFDAHTEAGIQEKPIEIDLPTTDDPFFHVTDFGKGLTETEMEQIFRRFGRSTKRTSNEQIGCLGIGAKSAFAYTDAFSVISRTVRGTHRAITRYSVYLDETKMGRISILERNDNPDALTGITIEIPVAQEDFQAFFESTFSQLQFFKPQPIYRKGKVAIDPDRPQERLGEFGLELCNRKEANYLVMGGVGYPIVRDRVRVTTKRDRFTGLDSRSSIRRKQALDFVLRQGVILRLRLGAVEIDASREGLSYTPATIKVITIHCLLAYRRFWQQVNQKVCGAATYLDASFFLTEANSVYSCTLESFKHNGKPVGILPRDTPKCLGIIFEEATTAEDGMPSTQKAHCRYKLPKFQTFSSYTGKGQRCFIPVFHDIQGANSALARRMETACQQYFGAAVRLVKQPRGRDKYSDEPIGTEQYQKATIKKVFLRWFLQAYGNFTKAETDELEIPQLIDLFRQIGGALLSDFVPTTLPRHERVKGPKPIPLPKLPLASKVTIWCDGEFKELCSFQEKLTPEVVYWQAVDTYTKSQKAIGNSTYCQTTRQVRNEFRIFEALGAMQKTFPSYQFVLVFGPATQHEDVKALLPHCWLDGKAWLTENLTKLFPDDFRCLAWEKGFPYSLRSFIEKVTIEPFASLKRLLPCVDVKPTLIWLMRTPYWGVHKTIIQAEENGLYCQAKREVITFTEPKPTIPSRFPLLASINESVDAIRQYVELVLSNEQLQNRVLQLEAQIYASETQKEIPDQEQEAFDEGESEGESLTKATKGLQACTS